MSNQTTSGILELPKPTQGRLRALSSSYNAANTDPVVPAELIDQFDLRPGMALEVRLGKAMGGNGQQKNQQGRGRNNQRKKKNSQRKQSNKAIDPSALRVAGIEKIEGHEAKGFAHERSFDELTTIDPQPRLTLEHPGGPPACRLIDLFCPIGYGQRGMIVSPPKAGKTTLLQNIATAVTHNHPDVEVIALLIDERPEEVTDFRRNVPCTVWSSSNDHPPERHVSLSMLAIERAKRMAEQGKDVLILLDSLTRVGRAFNTASNTGQGTGRTLSGGLDAGALAIPKQLFGSARKFEEGGSLSIIATALVDTGSRGDQVIFEEFKGTGNMELILDRKIAEQRVFPAIDLAGSGTRKEHLLMSEHELETMTALRRRLLNMQPAVQMQQLLKALERFETNADLVGHPQSPGNTQA
jgi:transcription termination factor Rho